MSPPAAEAQRMFWVLAGFAEVCERRPGWSDARTTWPRSYREGVRAHPRAGSSSSLTHGHGAEEALGEGCPARGAPTRAACPDNAPRCDSSSPDPGSLPLPCQTCRDRDLGDCPGPALWFGGQQGRATHCQHRARMDHDAWHDCSWSFMEQRPELGTTWLRAAQREPQSRLASAELSSTAHGQGDGAQHRPVGPSTSSVPAEAGWQERGGRSEAQHFTLGAWFSGWYRPAWEG